MTEGPSSGRERVKKYIWHLGITETVKLQYLSKATARESKMYTSESIKTKIVFPRLPA